MQKEENLKKLKMEKRGDKMKTNKGITLIALVITIIVMLILVVVTIRISTKGGLFDYAGKAARETIKEQEQETLGIAYTVAKLGNETVDSKALQNALDTSATKILVTTNADGTLNVLFTESNNNYTVGQATRVPVVNPYDEDAWDLAYVCDGSWWSDTAITAGNTATGNIVAKFYKNGKKITPSDIVVGENTFEFPEGDAYTLVIEGTGDMGALSKTFLVPNNNPASEVGFIEKEVRCAWQNQLDQYFDGETEENPITPYITKVIVCEGITNISQKAFRYATSLTEIAIPASVGNIGNSAFSDCSNLTTITIPTTVTSIGASAFRGCTSLTEIAIPTSVTSIGGGVFSGCVSLTEITYNGTTAQWDSITKGQLLEYNKSVIVHCTDGDITLYYQGPGILRKN